MEKLKPYVAAILASFLCFGALSGCGARTLPPDYRETPFRGEIIWKRGALMLQGILCFQLVEAVAEPVAGEDPFGTFQVKGPHPDAHEGCGGPVIFPGGDEFFFHINPRE